MNCIYFRNDNLKTSNDRINKSNDVLVQVIITNNISIVMLVINIDIRGHILYM
jgi:hypothetical protein